MSSLRDGRVHAEAAGVGSLDGLRLEGGTIGLVVGRGRDGHRARPGGDDDPG